MKLEAPGQFTAILTALLEFQKTKMEKRLMYSGALTIPWFLNHIGLQSYSEMYHLKLMWKLSTEIAQRKTRKSNTSPSHNLSKDSSAVSSFWKALKMPRKSAND
jgi:hypothetical protein